MATYLSQRAKQREADRQLEQYAAIRSSGITDYTPAPNYDQAIYNKGLDWGVCIDRSSGWITPDVYFSVMDDVMAQLARSLEDSRERRLS